MESLLKKKSKNNLSERMSTFLEVGIEKQMSKIDKGFTFLATVGSTAPFIGLFGTVWGIMNSFPIYCNFKKYKFGNCSSRYSRSIICYCTRIVSCNPCRSCL
jgi:hypothetical protein